MSIQEPSQLKSDTARANGAKSRGPKSAATREISSRNSLRHGFTAHNTILLACESQADFDEMVARYKAIHQPATAEEEGLVKEMIAARWRIERLWTAETSLIDVEMIRQQTEVEKEFGHVDPAVLLAATFRSLSDNSHSLSLLSRYESRLQRAHDRTRKALRILQEQRKKDMAEHPSPQPGPGVPTLPIQATPAARTPQPQPRIQSPAAAPRPCNKKVQKRTQRRGIRFRLPALLRARRHLGGTKR